MKALLDKALRVCDSAEVYCREIFSTSVSIENGKMQGIESEKKTEINLRICKDGNMGSAIGTSLTDETILERALVSLENQTCEALQFPNETMAEVYCSSDEVKALTTEELVAMAFDASNRLAQKAPEIKTSIYATKVLKNVKLLNSSGFDGAYEYTNLTLGMATLNDQGFFCEAKEYAGGKLPNIREADIDQLVELHRLDQKPITLGNEKLPVIFSGNAMGSLMLRVLGGVNGGNVLKDVSPMKGKLGEQIFSDKITIIDDGAMPFGCNSCQFDDEGTRARSTVLYENGVLKNYLLSVGQAKKLEMMPTGNAIKRTLFSKEIEDAPTVFDTNLKIEGDWKPDQEIISGIKRGILITKVMGAHTGNINQGEFSLNIGSGYLIENGELTGKVKGGMIAGNIYDLFKNIEAIGSQYEPMRSIFYHMGYSPMVKFSEASIVGK